MQMEVHHALAGRRPDVHADIVAVGGIPLIQQPTGSVDEGVQGGLLGCGCVEERGHVPEGDEEEVAGADRVAVEAGVGEKSLQGGLRRGRWCVGMFTPPLACILIPSLEQRYNPIEKG